MNKKIKDMKKTLIHLTLIALTAIAITSCLDKNNDIIDTAPTGLVTVWPGTDSFKLQLDDNTVLIPTNISTSPYKDKVVRAFAQYTEEAVKKEAVLGDESIITKNVKLNWIDSILTKKPVLTQGDKDDELYGTAPIEIIKDWCTVAEDGFLTLRIRTMAGTPGTKHIINLVTGTNPENPFEVVLRHSCPTSQMLNMADGIVAFNLNDLTHDTNEVKVKVKWNSFSGEKSTEFTLKMHKE